MRGLGGYSEVYGSNKFPVMGYRKESEPSKGEKVYLWHTAMGLQAVDGLKPSEYLAHIAGRNIRGEISFEEVNMLLQTYYEKNSASIASDNSEAADKVSARIAMLLSERSFSFTPNEYLSIHRRLFTGIYPHAGCIRDCNVTKKELVLNGASVLYGNASELRTTLDYDLSEERKFSYRNLPMDEIIRHLAVFVSSLWQIHVFREGNTQTTAVFFIKYLRALGFNVLNDVFAKNAWYFRNSLIRANYNDLRNGVCATTEFLEVFLRNLLLYENHPLHNRVMYISSSFTELKKAGIENGTLGIGDLFSEKTAAHVQMMCDALGSWRVFGRSDVLMVLGLKPTRVSELLREMVEYGIIERVTGFGKGKYRFRKRGGCDEGNSDAIPESSVVLLRRKSKKKHEHGS